MTIITHCNRNRAVLWKTFLLCSFIVSLSGCATNTPEKSSQAEISSQGTATKPAPPPPAVIAREQARQQAIERIDNQKSK
jgi:hypothetical protein